MVFAATLKAVDAFYEHFGAVFGECLAGWMLDGFHGGLEMLLICVTLRQDGPPDADDLGATVVRFSGP